MNDRTSPVTASVTDLEKADMCERLSFPPDDPRHITVDKLLREYAAILRSGHAQTPADQDALAEIWRLCNEESYLSKRAIVRKIAGIVEGRTKARAATDTSTGGNCPRCKREPADKALLGSDDEGHICGTCWSNDRHADSSPVRPEE